MFSTQCTHILNARAHDALHSHTHTGYTAHTHTHTVYTAHTHTVFTALAHTRTIYTAHIHTNAHGIHCTHTHTHTHTGYSAHTHTRMHTLDTLPTLVRDCCLFRLMELERLRSEYCCMVSVECGCCVCATEWHSAHTTITAQYPRNGIIKACEK